MTQSDVIKMSDLPSFTQLYESDFFKSMTVFDKA